MKDLSIEHHAAEWASDAIPTRRDENGLGCFYRRDLQAAFEAGFALAIKTANPPTHILAANPDNVSRREAAADYRANRYRSHGMKIEYVDQDIEAAFEAGISWSRGKARERLEARGIIGKEAQPRRTLAEIYGDVTDPEAEQAEKDGAQTLEELTVLARKRGYLHPERWAKKTWDVRQSRKLNLIMGVDLASNQDFSAVTLHAGQKIIKIEELSDELLDQLHATGQMPEGAYEAEIARRGVGVPGEGEV